jgi:hypothetical protein
VIVIGWLSTYVEHVAGAHPCLLAGGLVDVPADQQPQFLLLDRAQDRVAAE